MFAQTINVNNGSETMRIKWRTLTLILLTGGSIVLATAQEPDSNGDWQPVAVKGGTLEIHPRVEWKDSLPQGPFVRLNDGGILGIDGTNTTVSHDEGDTWETRPLFTPDQNLKASSERAMVRTSNGTIVLVFMNMAEYTWNWNAEKSLPEPETDLDVWAIRSVDDGQTWIDAQKIYDGYCGDVHSIIQTSKGALITPVQELMYEDGRHALRPRYSTDEGQTWQRSNFLDIGGRGPVSYTHLDVYKRQLSQSTRWRKPSRSIPAAPSSTPCPWRKSNRASRKSMRYAAQQKPIGPCMSALPPVPKGLAPRAKTKPIWHGKS